MARSTMARHALPELLEPEPEPEPELELEDAALGTSQSAGNSDNGSIAAAARELLHGGSALFTFGSAVAVLRCLPVPSAAQARALFAATAAAAAEGDGLGWLRVSGWVAWGSCRRRDDAGTDARSVDTSRHFWELLARPLLLEPGAGARFVEQQAVAAGLRGALAAAEGLALMDGRALMDAQCLAALDDALRPHGLSGSNIRRATGACLLAVELSRAGGCEFRRSVLARALAILALPRRSDFDQMDGCDGAVQHMGAADESAACKGGRHNDAPRWWHGDAGDDGPAAAVHIVVARALLPELLDCRSVDSQRSAVDLWSALQPLTHPTVDTFASAGSSDFAWAVLCRFHAVLLPANNDVGRFDARDDVLFWTALKSALQSKSKHTRARSFFVLRAALHDQDDGGWSEFMQVYDSLENYPLQLLSTPASPGLWKSGLNAVFAASSRTESRIVGKPRAADWTTVLCELGLCHPNTQVRSIVLESCLDGTACGHDFASISDHFILHSILPRITGSRASVSAAQESRPVADLSDGEGPTAVPVAIVGSDLIAEFLHRQLACRNGRSRTRFFEEVLVHLQHLPDSASAEGQLQLFQFLACIPSDVGRGLLRNESVKMLGYCVERFCRAQPDITVRSHLRRLAVMAVAATVSSPSGQILARLLACFPDQWIMDVGLDTVFTLSTAGSPWWQLTHAVAECIDLTHGYQAKPSQEIATELSLVLALVGKVSATTGNMQPLTDALMPLVELLGSPMPQRAMQLIATILEADWCCTSTCAVFSTLVCSSRGLCEGLENTCLQNISARYASSLARDCLRFLHAVDLFCNIPALQTVVSRLAMESLKMSTVDGSAVLPILRVCVDGKLEVPIIHALLCYLVDLSVQMSSSNGSKELCAEYARLRWECILKLSLRDEVGTEFWTPALTCPILEQIPEVLSSVHADSQQMICDSFEVMQRILSVVIATQNHTHDSRLLQSLDDVFLVFLSIEQKSVGLLSSATTLFLHPRLRDVTVANNGSTESGSFFDRFHVKLCELGQTNPRLMAIVAIHFVRLWLCKPDVGTASHIIDLCCYTREYSSASACKEVILIDDDAERSDEKIIPARIAFPASQSAAAVRGIAHFALVHVCRQCQCSSAGWQCVAFKLLGMLLAKLSCAEGSYSGTYNDDSETCRNNIALWQSLCLLVGVVDCCSPPALIQELHDRAAQSCMRPHAFRVRQYIDCFLIQLLIAVPRLVPVWLPAALGDYAQQPQVASSLVVVALNVLMLLKPNERQLYFKPLFWKINAWCGYSSRKNQLHSIAVVSISRLLQAAEAAHTESLDLKECLTGWPRVSDDQRLLQLSMYTKADPETVSDLLKLNPVFDKFDLSDLCSYSCDQNALIFDQLGNTDERDNTRESRSFYDSIRRVLESGGTHPAENAIGGAKAVVKLTTQSTHNATSAWSAGASGDGIMYEQSLGDALQMVLPAGSMRIDNPEVELLSRNHDKSIVAQVNNCGVLASLPRHVETTIEHMMLAGSGNARPLPLLVCASHVQDARTVGALARVSEVLGSSGLCVQEASIVKTGPFVATSVGAGMWLPTEPVATDALSSWLDNQRASGYTIVAVEPCSGAPDFGRHASNDTCRSLFDYEFPARTVLVLGDDKCGHNAITLGLVDVVVHVGLNGGCADVGKGSLQPHISGALAIWSYMRSQLLASKQSRSKRAELAI